MIDDPDMLLEVVLNALSQADGDPLVLFHLVHEAAPQARTTALICALLTADRSTRMVFTETKGRMAEGDLALAAALTLAEAANRLETARTRQPLRLSDILD